MKHPLALILCLAGPTVLAQTTIGTFTGGDPGDGLDLEGNFTYAVNIGTGGAAGKAGDAQFTADNTPGVVVTAVNEIPTWHTATYGSSANDDVIEAVVRSIRWSPAPTTVIAQVTVEAGVRYKLQLLFAENCCRNRGFDVLVEGALIADDFNPSVIQGDVLSAQGAVITHEFEAADAELLIELDGNTVENPDYTDHNPIFNGFTLERLSASGDVDGDGLPDDWEQRFFGNLDSRPTDDPDGDTLTNARELELGSSPNDNDTDDDGLTDGAEVNTHGSDPTLRDTDGDRINDGVEVNTLGTSPTKADSDDDGVGDYEETRLLTNPADAASKPLRSSLTVFTGGDAGEGLDLEGTFDFAINAAGSFEAVVQGVTFLPVFADEVPGFLLEASQTAATWHAPSYGDSADDDALESVMQSIRWSNADHPETPNVRLTFSGLEAGAEYELQLIFAEACCAGRGFDVAVDGKLTADEFNPSVVQGGTDPTRGVVLTHTLFARSDTVRVILDGRSVTSPEINDRNAIIQAATLKKISKVDTDGDGLPDSWENDYFGNLSQDANGDPDNDTVRNSDEFADNTNPSNNDTDGDGLKDNDEKTRGTSPGLPDSDVDGLSDGAEVNTHGSNPLARDSDSDGLTDFEEVNRTLTNPAKADSDDDGFDDLIETFSKTDPNSAASKPNKVIVRPFTGGDPEDGLDFTAEAGSSFLYAFSVGGAGGTQVGDVIFTDETAAGITISSGASIAAWVVPEFGDSLNDDGLEWAIGGIRHTGPINVSLANLKPGGAYRVQLLFYEGCCTRGFDVYANGQLIADEFAPYVVQGGINSLAKGAAVIYRFIAATEQVDLVIDGRTTTTPAYTDRNPILNAVTLEEIAPPGDTDGDGLSDPWEIEWFGNITAQNGAGDPDTDQLPNRDEFTANSDPTKSDTDGDGLTDKEEFDLGSNSNSLDTDADGLTDFAEVKTHGTNPALADEDGDGLNDAGEVTRGTNSRKADTDDDGFSDLIEAYSGTSGTDAASRPTHTLVQPFTGGDAGEGLDLDGTFLYALNVGTVGAVGQARDANFTGDDAAGVTIAAPNEIAAWFAPSFGDSANDDVMELVMQSMRWSTVPVRIDLATPPGRRLKLQILAAEACCQRGFDLRVEGQLVADEFLIPALQGGVNNPARGAVISYEFNSTDDTVNIVLDGSGISTPAIADRNPIINGLTLEDIGPAAPDAPTISNIAVTDTGVAVTVGNSVAGTTYILEYKAQLNAAGWSEAAQGVASGSSITLTDANAEHRAGAAGFWRVRTP